MGELQHGHLFISTFLIHFYPLQKFNGVIAAQPLDAMIGPQNVLSQIFAILINMDGTLFASSTERCIM